jgi:hypothetical protein
MSEEVEVTQADRDAAAALWDALPDDPEDLGSGAFEQLTRAFARHRLVTDSMGPERLALNLKAYARSRGAPSREDDEEAALAAAREIIAAHRTLAHA